MTIDFLELHQVLRLHADLIERYGGGHGVRDHALLASVIEQPRAMFAGEYLHEDIFAMASAYLFHIVQNHPFIDGNKRTGAAAAIIFLDINGVMIDADEDGLVDITLATATGSASKSDIAAFFKARATPS
jgi:death-on-curing protein